MVHRAIEHGIHEIYTLSNQNNPALTGGVWNGGYFIDWAPLVAHIRYIPVLVYRHFNKREFNFWKSEGNYYDSSPRTRMRRLQESRGYTVAVKLPGILADCALVAALFFFAAPRVGGRAALAISAAYSFNPGIIMDSAHWSQPDSIWTGFVILNLYLLHRNRVASGPRALKDGAQGGRR